MTDATSSGLSLTPDPSNVGRARRFVRDFLQGNGADDLVDSVALVVSELVTNSFVHAGTEVDVRIASRPGAVRVEVADAEVQVPTRRHYAETSGTGRGLQLVDEYTSRWGVEEREGGKTVWFEIGGSTGAGPLPVDEAGQDDAGRRPDAGPPPGTVSVTLRQVPLLMHFAWQEHAATLLREFLLFGMDHDEDMLTKHAHASQAMALLSSQLPVPVLPDDPDALMAEAIEPMVTQPEVALHVPRTAISNFAVLDDLLGQAIAHARAGRFLSPPTQPEMGEMRQWLCREVARQAAGGTTATPWLARTDVRATLADQAGLAEQYGELAMTDSPLLATDEASIIVAASPSALALLGYDSADQLVGRRVIVVVPHRFHQAHIAGTTLNATNGRSTLLGVPITVPMIRADGTETPVSIEVQSQRIDDEHRVFVARFQAA